MLLQQFVVARVGPEENRQHIAHAGYGVEPGIDEDIPAMRARITFGTPRRALIAMRKMETSEDAVGPNAGMKPMIGSRPKRIFVPGTTKMLSISLAINAISGSVSRPTPGPGPAPALGPEEPSFPRTSNSTSRAGFVAGMGRD